MYQVSHSISNVPGPHVWATDLRPLSPQLLLLTKGKLEMTSCFSGETNHVQDFEGSTWRITHEPVHHTESHQLESWLSKGGGDS